MSVRLLPVPKVGQSNESARVQWLEKTLKSVPAGARILDAGAGQCQFRKFCGHLEYVAQDFAQYDGSGDGTGLHTKVWDNTQLDIVGDIASIPEPDESFDAVMCTEVLEHIPHPIEALREFGRLLKSGGDLIVTAPFASLTHFAPYHFQTGYNRYFYERYLPEFGFTIVEMVPNGNYFEFVAQELQRVKSVALSYTGDRPNKLEAAAVRTCLWMLERFSRKDNGSSELLHFGYHVHAVKLAPSPKTD